MTIIDFGQARQKKDLMAAVLETAQRHGIPVDASAHKALDFLIGNYVVESQAHYNAPGARRDDAWAPRPVPSKQAYVFLPFGWATRAISRSYIGYRFAEGEFHSVVVDHLPTPDEMVKKSELKRLTRKGANASKTLDDVSIQHRLNALLNNNLWRSGSRNDAPVWRAARDLTAPQSDLSPLLNDEMLEALGREARKDVVRLIVSAIKSGANDPSERLQMGERWQKLMNGVEDPIQYESSLVTHTISLDGAEAENRFPAFMQEVESLLSAHELAQKQAALQDFWERISAPELKRNATYHPRAVPLDPQSLEILRTVEPEYQTQHLYNFLTPLEKIRVKSDKPREKSKKLSSIMQSDLAERRRVFVETFPFTVAIFSQPDKVYFDKLKKPYVFGWQDDNFGEGFDIENVARDLFAERAGAGDNLKSTPEDVINFLRGQTVSDMGAVAQEPIQYTPYLRLLSPAQFPQTPQEWQYFKALVDADKLFTEKALKKDGETFAELGGGDPEKSLYDMVYPLYPVEHRGAVRLQNIPLILEYVNNFGSALFLPSIITMVRDVYYASRQHDNGLHSEMKRTGFDFPDKIDTQRDIPFETDVLLKAIFLPLIRAEKPHGFNVRTTLRMEKVLAELGGQGIPAFLARDINIGDIASGARDFAANCQPYFEWREQQPRVKEFITAPEKQSWLALPTPTNIERAECEMPLSMRNISSLLQLKLAYNTMDIPYRDRQLLQEVGAGIQYFMLTQPRDGDIVCMAKAEIKPIGSLNIFSWDEKDILFPETLVSGKHPDNAMPLVKDTLDNYGTWLADKHPGHTAERHVQSRDSLMSRPVQGGNRISNFAGHDVFNLTENTQVTNFLRRYSAWPMKGDGFSGTVEIDGLRVVVAQMVAAMFNTETAHILRLLNQQSGGQTVPARHLRAV